MYLKVAGVHDGHLWIVANEGLRESPLTVLLIRLAQMLQNPSRVVVTESRRLQWENFGFAMFVIFCIIFRSSQRSR
jgi:hypothetical protein